MSEDYEVYREWMYKGEKPVEGIASAIIKATPKTLEEGEYEILDSRPKATLLKIMYEGNEMTLWFPKKAVVLGPTYQVEPWFMKAFLTNVDDQLNK